MFRPYIIPAIIVAASIALTVLRPEFVDVPSLMLTVGGALSITLFSYSGDQRVELTRSILALLNKRPRPLKDHVDELAQLTRLFRLEGLKALELQERLIADGFVRKGVGLLIDLEKEEKIRSTLEQDLAEVIGRDEISRQILSTLGKLLPSFGLIGTLIGMVLLLRNMGGQDVTTLPGAISLAVLTTLYGAVFANIAVAPLAARLHAVSVEQEMKMRLTIDWAVMLVRGESATAITDRLNGSLPQVNTLRRRARPWTPVLVSSQH